MNMFSLISTVLAQAPDDPIKLQPKGDFGGLNFTFSQLITGLIKGAMLVAAIVFFFMLVFGGIRWIMSGGDKGQTEAARNQITAALVGLVIVFAAWAIVQLISVFFGIDIFTDGLKIPKILLPEE